MNPLVDFTQTIQTTSAQSGTIVGKTADGVTVKLTSGGVVTFPLQPNLDLGDAVTLSNGRLTKSPHPSLCGLDILSSTMTTSK